MKKNFFKLFVIGLAMTTMLAGCSASKTSTDVSNDSNEAQTATAVDKDSVVIAITPDAEPKAGFDPINGWSATGHTHDPLIQSTLLTFNGDITLENDLATEYSVSDDGLTWTFKIRSDAKFSDDTPLTAKDVAFTFIKAKETVSGLDLSMIEKIEATDDSTATFTLNKPYSPLAYLIARIGIVPEHAYDSTTYGTNPIGSGPYVLKQWDKGQQVIFEANPNYYGTKPQIKKMTVVFMTEEASFAAAKAGEVDVAYTSAPYTTSSIPGYLIKAFDSVDHREINLPVLPEGSKVMDINGKNEVEAGNAVTSNKAVRQAISYAIDRQAIADVVFNGYATPAYSASPGMPWENEKAIIEYNPEKAKSIMEADGWALNKDGIYEKDGLLAEFTLTCMDETGRMGIAMAVKEMLDKFGIRVNIKGGMTWEEIDPTTYSTPNMIGGGQHSPLSDISRFYTGLNRAVYSNKTVDKHMDDGLAATSMEEAYKHFKLAAWDGTTGHITDADCPWVFIVSVKHIYFMRENLKVIDNQIFPHGYGGWAICDYANEWSWK